MDLKEKNLDLLAQFKNLIKDVSAYLKDPNIFDNLRPYFIVTASLFLTYSNENWIKSGQLLLSIVFVLFITLTLLKYNFFLSLATGYVVFSMAQICFSDWDVSYHWAPHARFELQKEVFAATFIMLAIIALFKNLDNIKLDVIEKYLSFFFVSNVLLTILNKITGADFTGWGVNASSNGTLIALSFFFFAKNIEVSKHKKLILPAFIALAYLALALSKAMIGLGSLALTSSLYFFLKKEKKLLALNIIFVLVGLISLFQIQDINTALSLTKRDKIWELIWKWFNFYQSDLFWGQGPGSFFRMFPKIQKAFMGGEIPNGKAYILAHNDLLESLFNIGIVGTTLWIGFFIDVANTLKKIPYLACFLLCYFINAMGNFPSHVMYSAIMLAVVCKRAINLQTKYLYKDQLNV